MKIIVKSPYIASFNQATVTLCATDEDGHSVAILTASSSRANVSSITVSMPSQSSPPNMRDANSNIESLKVHHQRACMLSTGSRGSKHHQEFLIKDTNAHEVFNLLEQIGLSETNSNSSSYASVPLSIEFPKAAILRMPVWGVTQGVRSAAQSVMNFFPNKRTKQTPQSVHHKHS